MSHVAIFVSSFMAGLVPGLLVGMRLEQRHLNRRINALQTRIDNLVAGASVTSTGAFKVNPRPDDKPVDRKEAKATIALLQKMQKRLSK
jgi:hypothetical protein